MLGSKEGQTQTNRSPRKIAKVHNNGKVVKEKYFRREREEIIKKRSRTEETECRIGEKGPISVKSK